MNAAEEAADILTEQVGTLGVIRLNRPQALNATTLKMIRAIAAALDDFERSPDIAAVAIEAAGDRAFCAGGDIRAIYDSAKAKNGLAETFWREEYRLISRISRYPKPFIALMDGLVMGGGVGLAVHGRRRVVTERVRLAMPESGIGFIPDVGATFILARAPGASGTYVALTGEQIGAADCLHVGMADAVVASAKLPRLREALGALPRDATLPDLDALLAAFAEAPEAGPLELNGAQIAKLFGDGAIEKIFAELTADGSDFAQSALATLGAKSPTSLKLTLELLRRARTSASLEDCLARELALAVRLLDGQDFREGIRAAVIDKDRAPLWSPASVALVDDDAIAAQFVRGGTDAPDL